MQFDKDINSPNKHLFEQARALLLSYDGVKETKKARITTYSLKDRGVCHMRTTPYGIDFGFLKGSRMENELKLLTGNGKVMRILPVKGELVEKEARYYIDQAVKLAE